MDLQKVWVKTGLYLGYPKCCAEWYVYKSPYAGNLTAEQRKVRESENGYVPCPECAKKIASGEMDYFDVINKQRRHSVPFPHINKEELAKFTKLMENEL